MLSTRISLQRSSVAVPRSCRLNVVRVQAFHIPNSPFSLKKQSMPAASPAPKSPRPKRSLVLAIDNSVESAGAFDWVMDNLWREGDTIHLVHVVPDLDPGVTGGILTFDVEMDKETKQGMIQSAQQFIKHEYLDRAKSRGIACTVDLIEETPSHANVGDLILESCNRQLADMLIMASHRRSAIDKLLMKSVSDYVSHKAKMPVIIYH